MRIVGSWVRFDDGESRPIIRAKVQTGLGSMVSAQFLVDTGADRSVFSADLLGQLDLPVGAAPTEMQLHGISGAAGFVLVDSVIELSRDDGGPARIRGTFAAFTDPLATDVSILGRDILNHFDVVLSRRNNEVLLLSQRHAYQVVTR
jgi:hypothetical protein